MEKPSFPYIDSDDIGEVPWEEYLACLKYQTSKEDSTHQQLPYKFITPKYHTDNPGKADDFTPAIPLDESISNYYILSERTLFDTQWSPSPAEDIISNSNLLTIRMADFLRLERESNRLDHIVRTLWNTYYEYSEEDWDGYGAAPITEPAVQEATQFLMNLPSSIPLPEVIPEPGGEIALEWYKGKKSVFVVSFRGRNVISYAGLFGENTKAYGTESFKESLPESILNNIRRIFPEDK